MVLKLFSQMFAPFSEICAALIVVAEVRTVIVGRFTEVRNALAMI